MNDVVQRNTSDHGRVGVVAIGRNEGERLRRCLRSLPDGIRQAVYVDSDSTDDSVAFARQVGVEVVSLDMSRPFTAARARNAGFRRLNELCPDLPYVLFLDGDCELVPEWLDAAIAALDDDPSVVAVCGYRRERYPDKSVYNAICDVEWRSGAVGPTKNFGGDVLMRTDALRAVGGYDPSVIAAEDDELGVRLRGMGGRLLRIAGTSTLHDAAMYRFSQWWLRAKRCGHGYAQVSAMHGDPPERYFVREARRVWIWGLLYPAAATALAAPTLGLSLGLWAAYPLKLARTYQATRGQGFSARESLAWAASCTFSKFPEVSGMLKYHADRLRGRDARIIEYKSDAGQRASVQTEAAVVPSSPR